MKTVLLFLFITLIAESNAQVTIPIKFKSEEENKLIRETDSVKYYEATGDLESVIAIDDENSIYKLLGKNKRVIDEGGFVTEDEKYLQDGKWTEHFENGKTSIIGYYRRGKPVGTWKSFYSEGHIKSIYNYGIIIAAGKIKSCLSGSYQEFYTDGKLKINGYYAAVGIKSNDTQNIEDPVTGAKTMAISSSFSYKAEKTGHWEYFSEDGELDKKEDF